MKRIPWVVFILASILQSCTRSENDNLLSHILYNSNDTIINKVLSNKDKYEVQVLYTQISRNKDSTPVFQDYSFNTDPDQYFYPASTVKLPVAILALEKIRDLQSKGIRITPDTPFEILDEKGTVMADTDTSHKENKLTVAHLIKKIFLVSDNNAYNYMYDFIGRDSINTALLHRGITDIHIVHRFSYLDTNHKTPRFNFYDNEGNIVYLQKSILSEQPITKHSLKGCLKGTGYIKEDSLIEKPMDFSQKNYASLHALNEIVKRIIFPETYPDNQQFKLLQEDYEFLRFWMSRVPTEITMPFYDREVYYDSYSKFFMYGDRKGQMSDTLRIYNKVGQAYGTSTDVAYIKDSSGIEFLLAATILTNENGIFNDGIYEYDQLGIPFLASLGRAIYRFEKMKAQNEN